MISKETAKKYLVKQGRLLVPADIPANLDMVIAGIPTGIGIHL